MKTYMITVPWSGYSRGYAVYKVTANNIDEAIEYCEDSTLLERVVIRDDTENVWDEADFEDYE